MLPRIVHGVIGETDLSRDEAEILLGAMRDIVIARMEANGLPPNKMNVKQAVRGMNLKVKKFTQAVSQDYEGTAEWIVRTGEQR